MVEGRSKQAFNTWRAQRPKAWRDAVEVVALDGFTGYKAAAAEELPKATAVMDPFHVVRLACDAVDRSDVASSKNSKATAASPAIRPIELAGPCTPELICTPDVEYVVVLRQRGLVLDANILIRLCLGPRVRNLVLDHADRVAFFTPAECFDDARRYLPDLLRRRVVDPLPVIDLLDGFESIDRPLMSPCTSRPVERRWAPFRAGTPMTGPFLPLLWFSTS